MPFFFSWYILPKPFKKGLQKQCALLQIRIRYESDYYPLVQQHWVLSHFVTTTYSYYYYIFQFFNWMKMNIFLHVYWKFALSVTRFLSLLAIFLLDHCLFHIDCESILNINKIDPSLVKFFFIALSPMCHLSFGSSAL